MFESAVKMQSNMSDAQIKEATNKITDIFNKADISDGNQDGFFTGNAREFIDLVKTGSDYMTSQYGVQPKQETDAAALERMDNMTYKPEYVGRDSGNNEVYQNTARDGANSVVQDKEKYTEKLDYYGNIGSNTTEVVRSRKDGKVMKQTLKNGSRVIYRMSADGTPYYIDGKDYVFVKADGTETRIDKKTYDKQLQSMTTANTNAKVIDDAKKDNAPVVTYGGITFNTEDVKSSFTQLKTSRENISGTEYTNNSYEVVLNDGTRLNWQSGEQPVQMKCSISKIMRP